MGEKCPGECFHFSLTETRACALPMSDGWGGGGAPRPAQPTELPEDPALGTGACPSRPCPGYGRLPIYCAPHEPCC
eukprot:gene15518-biopygen11239